jgi:reductive dehalogenase
MKKRFNRRQFIKAGGAAGAILGGTGLGFFGYESARDQTSYTGCADLQGGDQFFDREKFRIDKPHYKKVGKTSRVDARTEVSVTRFFTFMNQWDNENGIRGLSPMLRDFYNRNPESLKMDLKLRNEIYPKRIIDKRKHGKKFLLSTAWSRAMDAVKPAPIEYPPSISDFPGGERFGEPSKPFKMKNSHMTSKLIKRISHEMGATLVGISKLNHDWVYLYPLEKRGFELNEPIEVPQHWEYAIVIGCPMSWDPLYASPNYGTSNDADSRIRITAFRIASFIRQLGYAARPHCPDWDYDLIVPPLAIDAGLGEQGRHSVVVTPELGSNFKPAVITTNLPLQADQPIDFGLQDFCQHCHICADHCPVGAIPRGKREEIHGYLRYRIDGDKCHNFWYSNLGNIGCRICVAVCPFTRRSDWLHRSALHLSSRDASGISQRALSTVQKLCYPGKKSGSYFIPSMGGNNASYREPPWWLKTEDFLDE